MFNKISLLGFFIISMIHANESYELGKGLKVFDALTVGGYITTDYTQSSSSQILRVDDIAVLAYGDLSNRFSYLLELESKDSYTLDIRDSAVTPDFQSHTERLYLDWKYSDTLNFRLGKQITPIGYWGTQPISVLRDTTSNPIFSTSIYPRLFTGLDAYGYLPFLESMKYHLIIQKNNDLDTTYNKIITDDFIALALENEVTFNWKIGGSLGRFITLAKEEQFFAQLNTILTLHSFTYSAEIIRNEIRVPSQSLASVLGAYYLQVLYRQTPKHIWVTRFEHARDPLTRIEETFFLLGYSFRPLYPVSLKGEYQLHEDSANNQFLFSFSVLF